jgi:hypothetical protein
MTEQKKYKQIEGVYFNNFQKERIIKVNPLKKPFGWKAIYKDSKGYFTFESGLNNIRSYFKLKEDLNKIEVLKE